MSNYEQNRWVCLTPYEIELISAHLTLQPTNSAGVDTPKDAKIVALQKKLTGDKGYNIASPAELSKAIEDYGDYDMQFYGDAAVAPCEDDIGHTWVQGWARVRID